MYDSSEYVDPDNFMDAFITWLKEKLKVDDFTRETLYFIKTLSIDFEYEEGIDSFGEVEQEKLIQDIRAQLEREKVDKAELKRQLLEEMPNEEAKQALKDAFSSVNRRPIQVSMPIEQEAEGKDRKEAQPKMAELASFNKEEIAGIEAVAAYHVVLYRCLPKVRAFREEYLNGTFLTEAAAKRFLTSPAIRYLSAADITREGYSVAEHEARLTAYQETKISAAQRKRLKEKYVVYSTAPHFTIHSTDPSWIRFSVTIEFNSVAPIEKQHQSPPVHKVMLSKNTPYGLLRELFVKEPSANMKQPEGFPRFFPGSVADKLWDVIEPSKSSIPGSIYNTALFVLTGTLQRGNPVYVGSQRGAFQGIGQTNRELTKYLLNAEEYRGGITISAEPWVTSDTIKTIYEKAQESLLTPHVSNALSEPTGKKKQKRYKMPQAATLHLVTEVLNIYNKQPKNFTLKLAYDALHKSGKVTGKYEAFRQAHRRACQALNLSPDIGSVVRQLAQMK